MLGVVVKGGTNAGRRIIRATPAPFWFHRCDDITPPPYPERRLPSSYARCPDCGTRRS